MTADPRMTHFLELTAAEQHAAIRRLADAGMGEYSLARATGMAVEVVRRILSEGRPQNS